MGKKSLESRLLVKLPRHGELFGRPTVMIACFSSSWALHASHLCCSPSISTFILSNNIEALTGRRKCVEYQTECEEDGHRMFTVRLRGRSFIEVADLHAYHRSNHNGTGHTYLCDRTNKTLRNFGWQFRKVYKQNTRPGLKDVLRRRRALRETSSVGHPPVGCKIVDKISQY